MLKNENPHLNSEIFPRVFQDIPSDHPTRQNASLTQLQEAFLPALMWFFDANRYRGQGRSTLFAHVCIRLAMRGETVYLDDVHTALNDSYAFRERQRTDFADTISRLLDTDYRGHRFEFRRSNRTLSYRGAHPR